MIFVLFFKDGEACHPYKPFKCPEDDTCISIQYLCDGAPDCREGYDEDPRLCTAGKFLYIKPIVRNEIEDGYRWI